MLEQEAGDDGNVWSSVTSPILPLLLDDAHHSYCEAIFADIADTHKYVHAQEKLTK